MRLPRHRRTRSWSKDRSRPSGRWKSVCAFLAGALLTLFVWKRLQSYGVPGPWARPTQSVGDGKRSSSEELKWLRLRRDYLLDQLDIADARLASLDNRGNGGGVPEDSRKVFPPDGRLGRGGEVEGATPYAVGSGVGSRPGLDLVQRPGDEGAAGVGVKAEGHFILGLSTEAFRSTPVDEMMAQYDTHSCDSSFGNGLVDKWRQTGTECCGGSQRASSGASAIRCHLVHQDNHHGDGDNLVHMTNVQVDLSDFNDPVVATRVMQAYKNSKHQKQAYVQLQRGSIKGTCTPDPASWQEKRFPGWNADWTTRAFQTVEDLQCDEWVEHPVLVVQRDTFANLFHDSEDFVNAFLAMAILRKSPADMQVFLTDLYPRGPFWPIWDKVFGVGRPTLTAWEVGKLYGGKKVCFRDLTVGIFGPAAPTTLARMASPCFHTALVTAYADFVIRGLGLQGMTSYASPPSNRVVVTWVARRSSVQWPERAYCSEDGSDSFFTCEYFGHLAKRELQRRVKNEDEVVRSLRTLEGEGFVNGAVVEIRDMDYNLLCFEDQIINDLETDIMIGPHGAGLFHTIFTPDRAALIELQIDQTTSRKHFNNLAGWSGHDYVSRGGPNPVRVAETKAVVHRIVSGMDLTRH